MKKNIIEVDEDDIVEPVRHIVRERLPWLVL